MLAVSSFVTRVDKSSCPKKGSVLVRALTTGTPQDVTIRNSFRTPTCGLRSRSARQYSQREFGANLVVGSFPHWSTLENRRGVLLGADWVCAKTQTSRDGRVCRAAGHTGILCLGIDCKSVLAEFGVENLVPTLRDAIIGIR